MSMTAFRAPSHRLPFWNLWDPSQQGEAETEDERAKVKKMDMAAWKKHLDMQHRPPRRDCRRCFKMMGWSSSNCG